MTSNHSLPRLLAIIALPQSRRVMCQNPGCGHGAYAAVHLVEDGGQILVLGTTCYARRYGSADALGAPAYSGGGGGGRALTEPEREMLLSNTAELIELFKRQHAEALAEAQARQHALLQARPQPSRPVFPPLSMRAIPQAPPPVAHPWPWQHSQSTSVAVLHASDGQSWVRVMHRDGKQRLVPWPVFDGWDEVFPRSLGVPDDASNGYVVPDIVAALQWLRARGYSQPQVSRWPEVTKLLPPR